MCAVCGSVYCSVVVLVVVVHICGCILRMCVRCDVSPSYTITKHALSLVSLHHCQKQQPLNTKKKRKAVLST